MPDAPHEPEPPHCPVCGYERRGIDAGALCPECGADGLEGVFVVEGRDRVSRVMLLIAFAAYSAIALWISGSMVWRMLALGAPAGASIDAASVVFVSILFLPAIALGIALWKVGSLSRGGSILESPRVAWIVHPAGLEIVEGGRRRWIPRESIRAIRRTDSFMFPVSQLQIGFAGRRRVFGTTPILHVRGEAHQRAEIHRRMRAILDLADDSTASREILGR